VDNVALKDILRVFSKAITNKDLAKVKALKAESEHINVGCHKCDSLRPQRCCEFCNFEFGYFRPSEIAINDIPRLIRHFNVKTGFWRPNKGCILPRELRSITCVTHYCHICATSKQSIKMDKYKEKLLEVLKCA
jgi:hypothetical protein